MLISLRSMVSVVLWLGLVWVASAATAPAQTVQCGGRRPSPPAALTPSGLRCEYRLDPLGVDVSAPRLSWIVESTGRGQKQTAYQLLVAGDEIGLGRDEGDLWDSGRVHSDETTAVVSAGRRLRSHQLCFWKVRAWDKEGHPSAWSQPARWSMGLLGPSDWGQAAWIGWDKVRPVERPAASLEKAKTKAQPAGVVLPPPRYLRTTFQVERSVRRATLYATALGIFDVHLNSRRVSEEFFNPGWTDYTKRVYYRAST